MPDTWETASGVERLEWLVQATGGKVYRNGKPLPAFEPRTLDIIDIATLAARVEAAGPVRFLVAPLWPGDAYGVLGAEKKAGKTWADLDLAVSVALGLKWFGRYDVERPGAVVVFAGEGGGRNIIRRIKAIAKHKGAELGDLAGLVRICERVPKLTDPAALEATREDLREHPETVCGIIDPLYLAASGAKGSDLYAMGDALRGIQEVFQDADTALVVTTHWNKTGTGSGADRFTGVGPAEWGRVLGSAAIEQSSTNPEGMSEVTLRWEFTGSEIPETDFRIVRRVWSDDPDDLMSPLHYTVEVTDEGSGFGRTLTVTQQRVLDALAGSDASAPMTVRAVGDVVARDGKGKPLKVQTIRDALKVLKGEGLAQSSEAAQGEAGSWWLTPTD